MSLRIIGEHPLARNAEGRLNSCIGTVFPRASTLVTLPGIHALQRLAYVKGLNRERAAGGLPPLTEDEETEELAAGVDLIVEGDAILIRPDPDAMGLAFDADEILQELAAKPHIRFLNVANAKIRQAVKARGECWRIAPLPRTVPEMKASIALARVAIHEQPIYYLNKLTGIRYLTCQDFARLADLEPSALARQLEEIRDFSARRNRLGHPEIAFFLSSPGFGSAAFASPDFPRASPAEVREAHARLAAQFRDACPPAGRRDDPDDAEWRNLMFSTLIRQPDETLSEEVLGGLSPEFYMQIEWLPGGRIEGGEMLFDSVFEERDRSPSDSPLRALCDDRAKGFIFNFIREFGDIEYVNVGRVIGSLSRRGEFLGRRAVYVAEIKERDVPLPRVRIIRMQKWDIRERLDEGKDLLQAILESEDYTDYILDRRLGCRQLGMNLPSRMTTRKITEIYHGRNAAHDGRPIRATYFEREYVAGIATDKIPLSRFGDLEFALRFAHLLGRAAASNIVVGRAHLDGSVLFDDGDEVLIEGSQGLPLDIVVSDHTGTFANYVADLGPCAAAYAQPINRRAPRVASPVEFADAYLWSFVDRFVQIQQDYRKRRRAFDTLFKHLPRDERGSFAYRWEQVLARLDRTDAVALGERIRQHLALP